MTPSEIRALPKDAMTKVRLDLAKAFFKGNASDPKTLAGSASVIVDAQLSLMAEIAAQLAEHNERERDRDRGWGKK